MTRPFRLEEDERRYFALRSEFFVRLAQSGVPTQTVHEIMRNFGKLEDAMFFEGVRQGMVAALLSSPQDMHHETPALGVHHAIYGAAATPLARVEEALVSGAAERSNGDHGSPHALHPWLSKEPMRFGPLTLTEAIEQFGPDLVVKPAPTRQRGAPPPDKDFGPQGYRPYSQREPSEGYKPHSQQDPSTRFDPMDALDRLANGEDPADVFGPPSPGIIEDAAESELKDLEELPLDGPLAEPPEAEPLHRPALLDQVRDVLLRLEAPPQTWQDLILMLMRETRHDAAFLDDLMSTPMGMTVVSQAKLFHLHPGAMPEIKAVPPPVR